MVGVPDRVEAGRLGILGQHRWLHQPGVNAPGEEILVVAVAKSMGMPV